MYKLLPFLLGMTLLLSACTAAEKTESSDVRLEVVTSFYPVYLVAREIIGGTDGVRLTNMAPAETGCLHDYTLTMNDRKLLEKADLFLCCGAGMESFLDEVTDAHTRLKLCETADGAALLPSVTGETDNNPHVWMSVDGVCTMAGNIAAVLAETDPTCADRYLQNCDTFCNAVRQQFREYADKLEDARGTNVVSFHESFAYLAQDFGLNIVAVIAKEPDEEPSARELETCIEAVRAYGVSALFSDRQYSDRAAQTVAEETGAEIFAMDSLVSGEEKDDYGSLMRVNYETLLAALT